MIFVAIAFGLVVSLWIVARARKRRSRGGPSNPLVIAQTADWSGPRPGSRKRGRQGNL